MKVTITIEDDGGIEWGGTEGPYIKGPYIKGPYIKGPTLVIPREDGTETMIDIAGLEKAAGEGQPPEA